MRISSCIIFTLFISLFPFFRITITRAILYPVRLSFGEYMDIYRRERERRKLGKVGNWIFFIPIFSSSPTASFHGIDIEPIKRITGKLFLPRITMLVGKTHRSKCRNAGRVRRALGDPLLFENARRKRERERRRDVNVFRDEDVPWPRAAPTKPWNGSQQQQHLRDQTKFQREKKEIRDESLWLPSFSLEKLFNPSKIPRDSSKRSHALSVNLREIFAQFLKACNFYRGAVQN